MQFLQDSINLNKLKLPEFWNILGPTLSSFNQPLSDTCHSLAHVQESALLPHIICRARVSANDPLVILSTDVAFAVNMLLKNE